jgi:hypothetical protein
MKYKHLYYLERKFSNYLFGNSTGPPYLPLIGSALFVPRKLVHLTMAGKWLQKYGPVVGLVFASRKIIAICGAREVLEVLQREEFQARPTGLFSKERSFGKRLGKCFFICIILTRIFFIETYRRKFVHVRRYGSILISSL